MIGYHYTGHANWVRIRGEGLVPYPIDHPDMAIHGVVGIWLWRRRQGVESHAGNAIFQASAKGTFHVVELEVEYAGDDEWQNWMGDRLRVTHTGVLGVSRGDVRGPTTAHYHVAEPSIILGRPVPPARIRLVADMDLASTLSASRTTGSGMPVGSGASRISTTATGT